MLTHKPAVFLCVAVLLTVGGCDGQEPTAPTPAAGPNLGAMVVNEVQYRHPVRLVDTDGIPGWDYLLLGYEPADDDWCNGGVVVGGIPVRDHIVVSFAADDFDLDDGSTWRNGEAIREMVTTIGQAPMHAYTRASYEAATDGCDWLMNDWFAVGTWTAQISFDTDITGADDTPGMDVWGTTERGVLRAVDGTVYRYRRIWRVRFAQGWQGWEVMKDEHSFGPVGR